MVFLWGVCVAATAGVTNFATLAVARFFLGLFEASNNPVFTLLVSQYYTRQEHALRACLWWAGGPIAAFIGDGVSNGIGHFNGALSRWQYLYLIFGPITMAWGIFLFFAMPSSPMTAWFLTPRERQIAVVRVSFKIIFFSHKTGSWLMYPLGLAKPYRAEEQAVQEIPGHRMLPRPPGLDALCHCVPSMYSRRRIDCCK